MATRLSIGLARHGCANRPFYHISVMHRKVKPRAKVVEREIEQIGSYDPLPNRHNEKLIAVNYERLRYWIGQNARPSQPVAELLGLAGFLPLHPMTIIKAKRNRAAAEAAEKPTETESETDIDPANTDKDTS